MSEIIFAFQTTPILFLKKELGFKFMLTNEEKEQMIAKVKEKFSPLDNEEVEYHITPAIITVSIFEKQK